MTTTLHHHEVADLLSHYTLTELQEQEIEGIEDIKAYLASWQAASPSRERDKMISHWAERLADSSNRFFLLMSAETAASYA